MHIYYPFLLEPDILTSTSWNICLNKRPLIVSGCLSLTSTGAGCRREGVTDEGASKTILCRLDKTLGWTVFIPTLTHNINYLNFSEHIAHSLKKLKGWYRINRVSYVPLVVSSMEIVLCVHLWEFLSPCVPVTLENSQNTVKSYKRDYLFGGTYLPTATSKENSWKCVWRFK